MKQVLIVDDEESTRLLLGRILESIPDLAVTMADGGEAALRLCGERNFDVILMDLLMPVMDGIEVLTQIRSSSPNKKAPVIIVSVLNDPATQIACRSLGVHEYVVKPIKREAVIEAVKGALGLPA